MSTKKRARKKETVIVVSDKDHNEFYLYLLILFLGITLFWDICIALGERIWNFMVRTLKWW